MTHIEFEVGKKYENMKGVYEVLSIDRNTMQIRWENGDQITTTVTFQKRVIQRIQREQEELEKEREKKEKEKKKKKKKT